MTTEELTEKALEIRARYTALAEQTGAPVWSTQDIAQGLVGDVGDLTKLVMAKSGLRSIDAVDEKLAHELVDCLWAILVMAHEYNIDIEDAFAHTMSQISARILRSDVV